MSRLLLKKFRKDPPSSQYGSIQKLSILIILAGAFLILVVVLAWFALDRVKERIQADVSDALQIVLHTTQESLNLWVESNKFQLTRLAEDPRLVFLAGRQLSIPRNKKALLKSHTLQELRDFFRYGKDQFGQARFFIISPDFVNIASMRDENIGAKNLIANQALDLLNKAFQGEAVMVPPIWSDIPLITPLDGKNKKSAAMFFAAPIKDIQEKVIAVIAQRVDPSIDFTRLIQLGRIGKSGDTYAFGQYGKLLSESRFDEDLVKAGMIAEGETSILVASVRDPGGDMTSGFTPSVPRYQQPLTLMAQQATKGKAGLNVEGYRDYRGVRVYGAWLWDDQLGIGLTTEIDEADALGPFYTVRTVILTVLGITVLLALGSLVFAVLIDVRANRALQKSYDELELRVEERTAELKENQARLEQAEERSRLLLEFAEEGIFGVGEDGLVNFINPAGLALLGFEAVELIGQKIHPLIHHTRPDGTPYPVEDCPMYHSLTQGTIGNQDDEVLWRKDGSSFHVEYTSVPIRKKDSIAGTVVVFRDISERKQAEEALRESEINMRTIFENSPLGLIHFSKDGTILDCNDMFVELMGSSREKLIGFNTPKQTNDEKLRAAIIRALAGETAEYEGDYTSVTGNKTISLRIKFNPTEPGTSPTQVIATLEDISERKKAEQALRESRATARGLLDATQESLLLLDKEGIIIAVNQTAARRHQKTPEELIGANRFDLLPQDLRESRKVHFNNVLQSGNPADFEDVRDGMVFHHIYYPVQDKAGAIMGIAIFAQDITERKRAEEAIRESQERLSTSQQTLKIALESSNTGVWKFDPRTNETTFQSEEWYKQIGYQRDEFKADQDPFADLLHPDDKAVTLKTIEDHLEGVTKTFEKEFRLKSKNGTWRWILSKGQITKRDSDGKATEMTGVHLDITERRHMEDEMRQKVDELERFSKVAFGREKKMIQLKQEINELMIQLGKVEKYKIVS